jgi:hypothetical protein
VNFVHPANAARRRIDDMRRRGLALQAISLIVCVLGTQAVRAECVEVPFRGGGQTSQSKSMATPPLKSPMKISGAFCGKAVMAIDYPKSGEIDMHDLALKLIDADHPEMTVRQFYIDARSNFNVGLPPGRYRVWLEGFHRTEEVVEIVSADQTVCRERLLIKMFVSQEECEYVASHITPLGK